MPLNLIGYSKEIFYAYEPRQRSGEVDFGVMWTNGARWPTYRVSWIKDTGELYVYEQRAGGLFTILGKFPTRADVELALTGWTTHCNAGVDENGLEWVYQRVRAFAESGQVAVARKPAVCGSCGGSMWAEVNAQVDVFFRADEQRVYAKAEMTGKGTVTLHCDNGCHDHRLGPGVAEALMVMARAAASGSVSVERAPI